jgi:phosphate-selective porin OprO and OprP
VNWIGRPVVLAVLLLPSLVLAQEAVPPAPAGEASPPAPEVPSSAGAVGPSAAEIAAAALRQQLDEVDQRSRVVERKLELIEEAAAAAKAATPVVSAGERGFNFKSADGLFAVKVRGLVHADAREYLDDAKLGLSDTFLIRRARPLLEATFADLADFRLMPDFGGGTAVVQDAYVDLRPAPWFKLRAGKYKPPLGLERLQSAAAIVFPERALPTLLVPNRDVGFMIHGLFGPGVFSYELGVFNGVVDGGSGDADNNHAKDFVGRLFAQPFKGDPYSLLANFGIGIAASVGNQRGVPATFSGTMRTANSTPLLPAFRSAGSVAGSTFFSYASNEAIVDGTPIAKGQRRRLAPQGYFYYGPFGIFGEYVQSTQAVRRGAQAGTFTHRAWQAAAFAVVGGKPLFEGTVVTTPFDPAKATWGALELGLRYNELRIDEDVFTIGFANASASASRARALGAVLNWHWNKNLKLVVAYEHTAFKGGLDKANDRKSENVLFQRVQAAF